MYKVTYWQPLSARQEMIKFFNRPMCEEDDGINWPCTYRPHYVLARTANESGSPGRGEARYTLGCSKHMGKRVDKIPFEYAGSVALTRYAEVQE